MRREIESVSAGRRARPVGVALVALGLCALVLGVVGAAAASGSSKPTTVTIGSFDHEGPVATLRHPRRFKVESADSYVVFSGLRWRHWGARHAVAHGYAKTCDYLSGCHSHRTTLRADRRHACLDGYAYGRVVASVVPLYGGRPIELPVEEAPC
jgi:hypothetical protein